MNYNWNWLVYFDSTGISGEIYLYWFGYGLLLTVAIASSAWVIAMIVGTIFGVARTLDSKLIRGIGMIYVEVFRNVPLLVQLFIWYYIVPDLLPEGLQRWFKLELDPAISGFILVVICLGLYTGARVCEQLRAGIQSISVGQSHAALALGFSVFGLYRFILLPQAFRIIIPPMTSELLNVFKNSSVAHLVGLAELLTRALKVGEFTANFFEALTLATLIYLTLNLSIMYVMNKFELRLNVHKSGT